MNTNLFEKIKDFVEKNKLSREELIAKIIIIAIDVIKKSTLNRKDIDRIQNNITNILEIFRERISDIAEIKPYLHRETIELLEKLLTLILANNITDEMKIQHQQMIKIIKEVGKKSPKLRQELLELLDIITNEVSKFSIKNNAVALSLGIFIDYLIFRDSPFSNNKHGK